MRTFITICWLVITLATQPLQTEVCSHGELLIGGVCQPGLKTYFPIVLR